MKLTLPILTAATSLALAGCAAGEADTVAEARQAILEPNGTSLNGVSLNGRSLNGRSLNGRSLNGVSLNGVSLNGRSLNGRSLNGASLDSVTLDGTQFHATATSGRDTIGLDGTDFVGMTFTGTLDDGSSIAIRVDSMTRSKDDHEVWFYGLSARDDGGWSTLCTDENGAPTTAIPLAGRWNYAQGVPGGGAWIDDPSAFTFACRTHAIAKCVELGYAPWESVKVNLRGKGGKSTVALADYHQACTRLIRADYCGDGTPHTIDGTLINLYDGIGVQDDTEQWSFEAEWTPSGASCASRQRISSAPLPSCWSSLPHSNCGATSHFTTGALIMSEDAQ